ncbi:hypothetical protein LJ656_11765 [Paraburkholderia sp. MMS20-SJTR3]|uniref:Uncharacterized protein n=1 Tax=Paraburkholderia sejongensis TaxID=2886946 RepID=A0ABS8JTN9_9BURK|nr:hypothetical protein [Paraburkholderia sp. MMS20-SJTR3]MCC8393269.1 hypothetical protein [Paraburkholderia sp. MMS20-SJTR3]
MKSLIARFSSVALPARNGQRVLSQARCCAACRHRLEERDALEQRIPGLVSFSSGFGASVAASRLCRLHDQLVSPGDRCARFEASVERS